MEYICLPENCPECGGCVYAVKWQACAPCFHSNLSNNSKKSPVYGDRPCFTCGSLEIRVHAREKSRGGFRTSCASCHRVDSLSRAGIPKSNNRRKHTRHGHPCAHCGGAEFYYKLIGCKGCTKIRKSKNNQEVKNSPERKVRYLLSHAKKRSESRFESDSLDLLFNDIIRFDINSCQCCSNPIVYSSEKRKRNQMPSIDRINNSLGYVVGNVCVICYECNSKKSNLLLSDLKMIESYINTTSRL